VTCLTFENFTRQFIYHLLSLPKGEGNVFVSVGLFLLQHLSFGNES